MGDVLGAVLSVPMLSHTRHATDHTPASSEMVLLESSVLTLLLLAESSVLLALLAPCLFT